MVRLKGGGMLRWGDKVYPISIPYGAIKSFCSSVKPLIILTFQFLMVRLKVAANICLIV